MQGRPTVPTSTPRHSANKWQVGIGGQTPQVPSALAWVTLRHVPQGFPDLPSDTESWLPPVVTCKPTLPSLAWRRTQLRQPQGSFTNLKLVTFTSALNLGVRKLANFRGEEDDHLWSIQYLPKENVCCLTLEHCHYFYCVDISQLDLLNHQTYLWLILVVSKIKPPSTDSWPHWKPWKNIFLIQEAIPSVQLKDLLANGISFSKWTIPGDNVRTFVWLVSCVTF